MTSTDTIAASPASDPIEEITRLQLAMMERTGRDRRGQHFKPHGCVWARFEVLADIPDRLKVGLFASPAIYTAYIRFSNGAQLDDTRPDIHGMAIKLTGVPGRKILDQEAEATTHDFVLADNPVFFIRDTLEYLAFMRDFERTMPSPPTRFIAWLEQNRPGDLPALLNFRQQIQDSPLTAHYFSQVPYWLGTDNTAICRYGAVPRDGNMQASIPPERRNEHYLQQAMIDQLTVAGRPAMFDFTMQIRDDVNADLIDNPTVTWDPQSHPVDTVAVITIPPQTFSSDEQMRFCEALAYTPWHALPEHRPAGQINAIRKAVYVASARVRQEAGHAATGEPTGREHWGFNMRLSQDELTKDIDEDFKQVVARLQTTFNFMAAKTQYGRATHTYGAVARGEARCIVPAGFPETDTFVLGKVYPIVLRHSSPGGRSDDRARDGVAASIKFFELGNGIDGPGFYDILMNAGRQLFVRSIRDFSTFVHTPDAERIELVRQGVMLEPQLIEAYRIRGSFTDFRYYTWVCFELIDKANVVRYVRFRLINHDRGPDRGLPKAGFRANGRPSMEPEPDDTRAPDFLRKDFLHRVKHSDVRYVLQAQLRDAPDPPDINHPLFDPSQPWNEYWYPWVDVFDIRLDATIEDPEAVSRLDMNPNRSPFCIRIPLATSPDHYASLGHARAIIYPRSRAVRAALAPPQNN